MATVRVFKGSGFGNTAIRGDQIVFVIRDGNSRAASVVVTLMDDGTVDGGEGRKGREGKGKEGKKDNEREGKGREWE